MEGLKKELNKTSKELKNSPAGDLSREDRKNKLDQATKSLRSLVAEMSMTLWVLRRTKIGAVVSRFLRYCGEAHDLANVLLEKWSRIARQCTGKPLQALTLFQSREKELKQEHDCLQGAASEIFFTATAWKVAGRAHWNSSRGARRNGDIGNSLKHSVRN